MDEDLRNNKALPEDSEEISQYLEDFGNYELRKDLYNIAVEKREDNLKKAIKIILLTWNWRAYAGSSVTNSQLNDQVKSFLRDNEEILEYFENKDISLKDVDFNRELNGKTIGQYIIDNFNNFCEKEAVGSTGASKAFHMLYPKIFMMWDAKIIDQYHNEKSEVHWRGHKKGSGECYLVFLKETQRFIKEELGQIISVEKTPTKIMDEYNYAKYTLPEIRG